MKRTLSVILAVITVFSLSVFCASAEISDNGTYITGVVENTPISELLAVYPGYTVKNGKGNEVTTGNIGTGFTLEKEEKLFTVLVLGDVNGDGKVLANDYMMLKRCVLNSYTLNGAYYVAGCVSGASTLKSSDYMKVKRHVLGSYNLYSGTAVVTKTAYEIVVESLKAKGVKDADGNYSLSTVVPVTFEKKYDMNVSLIFSSADNHLLFEGNYTSADMTGAGHIIVPAVRESYNYVVNGGMENDKNPISLTGKGIIVAKDYTAESTIEGEITCTPNSALIQSFVKTYYPIISKPAINGVLDGIAKIMSENSLGATIADFGFVNYQVK